MSWLCNQLWYSLYKPCHHTYIPLFLPWNIFLLLKEIASLDISCRQIASQTGIGKSTVARVLHEIQPEKERHHGGRPSKLSPTNKQAVVQQIITGKVNNAVQATHFINSIISSPVSSQTVRNTLKEASFKAIVRKRNPCSLLFIGKEGWLLLSSTRIGL